MKIELLQNWWKLLPIVLLLGTSLWGQSGQNASATNALRQQASFTAGASKDSVPSRTPARDTNFVIGNEDVLAISVWNEPELSRVITVRTDGKISIPLIGELQASGKMPKELQAEIATGLQSFISEPEVTVIVQEIKSAFAQTPSSSPTPTSTEKYVLGPDDQITVRALEVEEIDGKTARVDLQGYIDLPLIGKIRAAGLSVDAVETELSNRLRKYVRDPQVSVTVSEYHSQPVSVLGAVNTPGVYNLTGPSTLEQVLSRAGGLRSDAGNTISITRRQALGPIPLTSAKSDTTGEFSTAQVNVKSLLEGRNPQDNITVMPTDIISVPRAELVYVVGAVHKPGGFVLNERESMTVLQALSMSEGLERTSAAKSARIIRSSTSSQRTEIPVNLSSILSGKSPDVPLLANDILFVPNSAGKSAALRALEAALQAGTFASSYAIVR